MSELKEKSGSRKTDRTFASGPIIHMTRETAKAHKRPLRTYSKRTAPTDSAEPVTKRQRINEAHVSHQTSKSSNKSNVDIAASEPTLPAVPSAVPPRKGIITAYFKKIDPPTSSSTLPSEASSDIAEATTTPPSSPPTLQSRRRKARRLTTRAVSCDNAEHEDEDKNTKESKAEQQVAATKDGRLSREDKDVLSSLSAPTLNRMETITRKRSEAGKRGKATTVQTTLSLSLTDTGFVECKDCNMLYNPIHEKDAKDHARVHAALRRAKSRTGTTATD
ncbi:hypothetical protein F4809DRAFT_130503 [Biscogniauxia mediterranea]|nr:hypothetical protein F4809DRAFT_130503 [Biscogniauxia mediterranea]